MTRITKLGVIKVSQEIYESMYKSMVSKIFLTLQPLNIQFEPYPAPIYKIICTHDDFDEVAEGNEIPTYDVLVTEQGHNEFSFQFKKL